MSRIDKQKQTNKEPVCQHKSPLEHCCKFPLAQACKQPLEPTQLQPDHCLFHDDGDDNDGNDDDDDDDDDGVYRQVR